MVYHVLNRGNGRMRVFHKAEDDYFLKLCRYVEANALRRGLVQRAEDWQWCGLWQRVQRKVEDELPLAAWPVERPRNWTARVNRGLNYEQMECLRICVERGRPLGPERWVRRTAARLGFESTLRGVGRPRKLPGNQ
jgi:putative transposase